MLTSAGMKKFYLLIVLGLFPLSLFCQQDNIFTLQNNGDLRIAVDRTISNDTQLEPFAPQLTISGLAFSGDIILFSDSSLVRLILTDNKYNEYLIYEIYPVLSGSGQFSVDEFGEETTLLDNIIPYRVTIEIVDASVHLKEFIISDKETFEANTKGAAMAQQTLNKIERINENIQNLGQKWVAGETSISKLSYQEKKILFGGKVPNFQGFEYYVGGIFVLPGVTGNGADVKDKQSENLSKQISAYPDEFSWTNRHGVDWVTPVKYQGGCNSCVAFGTTAAAELLVNLYFNKHLDYDLSEQNIVSCTDGSCKDGLLYSLALEFIKNSGIVIEDCFPYTESDGDCSEISNNPSEQIRIAKWRTFFSREDMKREIIYGATAASINYMDHTAQIVGYKVLDLGDNLFVKSVDTSSSISIEQNNPLIGKTAWLFKNSWKNWGIDGYGYIVGGDYDFKLLSLYGPVNSLKLKETDIFCTDNDGDGFYFWGIGPKPPHCPESPEEADGDDSNPCIGPMDEFGNLTSSVSTPEAKDTIILYGRKIPDLYVLGSNVRWYGEKELLNLVYQGNWFSSGRTEPGKYTYYVTETLSGCESEAKDVSLSIVTDIPPPAGDDLLVNVGDPTVLSVEGEPGAEFKWYGDPLLTIPLGTGASYDTRKTGIGIYTYYVTQTVSSIESAPDTVFLEISTLITIPDAKFRYALVQDGVDINGDNRISYSEAEATDSLFINEKGISDMTGIEAFVNLKALSCKNNRITHLDVSNNRALADLNCEGNRLTSLDVSNCTALTDLDCSNNQITNLDVSNNSTLERLSIMDNQITSLDVMNNPKLASLDCDNNELAILDVSNCSALTELACSKNPFTRLDVSNNYTLERLSCSENQLTSLDVTNNTALRYLNINGYAWWFGERFGKITTLNISNNPALEELHCSGNQLTSLDASGCNFLTLLDCGNNALTSLETSGCSALTLLHCSNNQLTSLDVSYTTDLRELYCGHNLLSSLDLSGNDALESLSCGDNLLSSLDISSNTTLGALSCSGNMLTSLNVSNNSSLERLNCAGNQLTSLDVSSNAALESLSCSDNMLSSLDVSKNDALGWLQCDNNQLINLDISQCTVLKYIKCSSNLLTTLDLCQNEYMMHMEVEDMLSLDSVFLWSTFTSKVSVNPSGSPNVVFIACGSGIESNTQSGLSIYPNPTKNVLNIELENREQTFIEITSLNGQFIYRTILRGTSHQSGLAALPKGVYFLTIRSKHFLRTEKIIKQ